MVFMFCSRSGGFGGRGGRMRVGRLMAPSPQHLQLGLRVLSQQTFRPLLHPQTPPCHEQQPDCMASSALAKVRPLQFAGLSTF
jgi:hypothetical protein